MKAITAALVKENGRVTYSEDYSYYCMGTRLNSKVDDTTFIYVSSRFVVNHQSWKVSSVMVFIVCSTSF